MSLSLLAGDRTEGLVHRDSPGQSYQLEVYSLTSSPCEPSSSHSRVVSAKSFLALMAYPETWPQTRQDIIVDEGKRILGCLRGRPQVRRRRQQVRRGRDRREALAPEEGAVGAPLLVVEGHPVRTEAGLAKRDGRDVVERRLTQGP
jgi:hypothetical protein